jgi:hypothetical protein
MEKELPPKCPTCQLATVLNQMTGDYDCQGCDRSWYVSEFDGESALSSRARKVKLRGWLTAGNNLDDIIIPDKPWVCRNYGSLPGKPPEDAAERQTYTCNKCAANLSCPYAWDGYNTNGDCLAEK